MYRGRRIAVGVSWSAYRGWCIASSIVVKLAQRGGGEGGGVPLRNVLYSQVRSIIGKQQSTIYQVWDDPRFQPVAQ